MKHLSLFITYGFFHVDLNHIVNNIIIILLYYPLLSKIANLKIWEVYLFSVFFAGCGWLFYINLIVCKPSILLGASGGIMGLISYGCLKWKNDVVIQIFNKKIPYVYLLYIHLLLIIINYLNGENMGGEVLHLFGLIAGFFIYLKDNK
jgi:membrane associated rhomboid family serine protease